MEKSEEMEKRKKFLDNWMKAMPAIYENEAERAKAIKEAIAAKAYKEAIAAKANYKEYNYVIDYTLTAPPAEEVVEFDRRFWIYNDPRNNLDNDSLDSIVGSKTLREHIANEIKVERYSGSICKDYFVNVTGIAIESSLG